MNRPEIWTAKQSGSFGFAANHVRQVSTDHFDDYPQQKPRQCGRPCVPYERWRAEGFGGVVALKSYLGLVPQYEKVHRKNNRISVLCIVLSVLLVTAIFSMADMALRAQKNYFIKTNGEYHISLTDIDEQTAELVKARIDVALCGWTYQGSAGSIGSKAVSFAGANEDTFST